MARRFKLKELEQRHGDLHNVIPALVNKKGQNGAALELGVSGATISNWLKDNGYRQVIRYEIANYDITEAGRALLQEMQS